MSMSEREPAQPPHEPVEPLVSADSPPPLGGPGAAFPASSCPALPAAERQALRELRERTLAHWTSGTDLWIFGYASLIWRPGFDCPERRPARTSGYHRALQMWSHVNRGTPQCPGLVFALLPGGSCQGVALRMPAAAVAQSFDTLWQREMPTLTYQPRWLRCHTPQGPVRALAFTLARHSPAHTGTLSAEHYRQVFAQARGHCGSTLDYARRTYDSLREIGIEDRALARLLALAGPAPAT